MELETTAARKRHTITVSDGTEIFFKDWGVGQPIVFSHGSPMNSDAWEDQMVFLAEHGYRCIAHDRRGHGRSSQPWTGNDVDTYADDLAALTKELDLHDAVLSATRPVPARWRGTSAVTGRHAWRRLFWSAP